MQYLTRHHSIQSIFSSVNNTLMLLIYSYYYERYLNTVLSFISSFFILHLQVIFNSLQYLHICNQTAAYRYISKNQAYSTDTNYEEDICKSLVTQIAIQCVRLYASNIQSSAWHIPRVVQVLGLILYFLRPVPPEASHLLLEREK